MKWVYKVKIDKHCNIIRHKAWFAVRGFMLKEGVDFEDAFAPVALMESVCLLLAASKD